MQGHNSSVARVPWWSSIAHAPVTSASTFCSGGHRRRLREPLSLNPGVNAGCPTLGTHGGPAFTCCLDHSLLNAQSKLDHRVVLILLRGAFTEEDINLIGNKPADRTPSG